MTADNTSTPIPYKLRIGVTGHRELPDPRGVAQAVERVLDHIENRLTSESAEPFGPTDSPHTGQEYALTWSARIRSWLFWLPSRVPGLNRVFSPNPVAKWQTPEDCPTPVEWTVISPLAKGADRIVAHAVCRRVEVKVSCDVRARYLEAVLPMPVGEYRKDFVGAEDLEEFNKLLARDPDPIVVCPDYPLGDDNQTMHRQDAYRAPGRAVVDGSEFVIAVWDGRPSDKIGGTADTVRYAVDHGRTVIWIDANHPQNDPRLLLRQDQPGATPGPLKDMWHAELPARAKELSPNFHRVVARDSPIAVK